MFDFRDSARRWTGGVFLTVSLLMVILGMTALDGRLKGLSYIYYWLTCILFTLAAAMVALFDFSSVRKNAVREQRKLIEEALKQMDESSEIPRKREN